MENITISLQDDLYRRSHITAAEANTTVTALVREFLTIITDSPSAQAPQERVLAAIQKVRERHPHFDTGVLLTRDELHARS